MNHRVLSSILSFFSFLLSSVCFFVAFYFYLYRVGFGLSIDDRCLSGVCGMPCGRIRGFFSE